MSPRFKDRLRGWLGERILDGAGLYAEHLREINARQTRLSELDDRALDRVIRELREAGGPIDGRSERLLELFAVVREVADRSVGLRPFDEQLGAGIALSSGAVVEMQTGEGKTLAAVAPAALAAISGDGVHVFTVNDYLARRDAAWMGPIYERLGLSVGVVQECSTPRERRRAYGCDVLYVTAREAGFDFLRNQLCVEPELQLPMAAGSALVDEADSIMIDEARIPLVIAGTAEGVPTGAVSMAEIARLLQPTVDFDTDEHGHNIFLTDAGSERVERLLGCDELYDTDHIERLAELRNALHALHLVERDRDYIVRRGRVELVDDFTGRVADRRQWPDGLQAAIEAKERIDLQDEGRILGSITMHHFLMSYPRLAGMTATASSSAAEFADFYDLGVVVVPPHRPCIRVDHDDVVFTHREAKQRALIEEIGRIHATGRPILVGTASVAESEELARELDRERIPCRVLNAKNDELEAGIVADAGAVGAVTISTNMAGRGTDIKLGGSDQRDREQVVALGGLYVIGTNRHESLRVDRQLRGRAGRQGDPGSSRFFISLEDPLIRRYGVERLISARFLPDRRLAPVTSPVVAHEIARAQRIVEGENLDIRRRLWEFSAVIESQRRRVQEWRQLVLTGDVEGGLLQRRRPERWRELAEGHPRELLEEIERRLTLLAIDRCWSDHLAALSRIRDGIHVVSFVGKDPATEFFREANGAFQSVAEDVEHEVVASFDALEVGADGVDWQGQGLVGPSATWTYLVSDAPFGSNPMRGLANRAGFATIGALAAAPVLFLWGLVLHWRRRRRRAALGDGPGSG